MLQRRWTTQRRIDNPRRPVMFRPMRATDTREHLLSAGLRTLHAHGFNASGVQDITDAAGVPKGSFYNHFDSKETFGAAVLSRYWEERAARALAVLSDETLPPLERLRRYFAAKTAARTEKSFDRGCMIGNFAAELSGQSRLVRDQLGAVLAAWTNLLSRCLAEAQAEAAIATDIDPDTMAAFLIDAFEGAVLRTKVTRDTAPLARFEHIVFTKLLA